MKKLLSCFLSFTLIGALMMPQVFAGEINTYLEYSISFDNNKLSQKAYKESEDYMFPIREISEVIGYKVDWSESDRTVTITGNSKKAEFKIGENKYTIDDDMIFVSKLPSEIKNDSTYVSAGFLDNFLDIVIREPDNGTISIMSIKKIEGIIEAASMTMLVLRADKGKKYSFNTEKTEGSSAGSLIIGSKVTVCYIDELEENSINTALKIEQ